MINHRPVCWLPPAVAAIFTALPAWLICFTPPSLLQSVDYLFFHQPNFHFLFDSLSRGELPLWNPYIGLGRPFLADLQSAVFYPPVYFFLLGEAAGLFLLLWSHLFLGVWGIQKLTSEFGAGAAWGWAAGAAFAASGVMTAHIVLGHILYFAAACYVPWIFLQAVHGDRGWQPAVTGRQSLLMAMQLLCGHPQVFWLTVVGQAMFLLARHLDSPWRTAARRAATALARLGLACLWALVLAAAALLPFFELIEFGNRSVTSMEFADSGFMTPARLRSLLWEAGIVSQREWEFNWFLGPVILLFGLAGLSRLEDRNIRGMAAMVGFALLLGLGSQTPFFSVFYDWLPGFSGFRLHARSGLLVTLGLIVAAALWLSRPDTTRRGRNVLVSVAVLLLVWVCWPDLSLRASQRLHVAAGTAATLTVGLVLVCPGVGFGRLRFVVFGTLALVFAIPVGINALQARRHYSFSGIFSRPVEFSALDKLLREFPVNSLNRIGPTAPPRVAFPWPSLALPPNHAMIHGYSDCDAYTSLFLRRPWDCLHILARVRPPEVDRTSLSLTVFNETPFPFPGTAQQFGFDSTNQAVIVRTNTEPRAWFATAATGPLDYAEVLRRLQNSHDQHASPLVEDELTPPLPASPAPVTPVEIRRFAANEIQLEVTAPAAGLLVLAEAWHPGWKAEVAGTIIEAIPANGWMRAFPLPAGQHRVRVFYEQGFLGAGCLISLLALAAVVRFNLPGSRRPENARDPSC